MRRVDVMLDNLGFNEGWREVDGIRWFTVHLTFQSGTIGVLEVLPTAGSVAESYEMFGPEYRMLVQAGGIDAGRVRCWENGRLVVEEAPARDLPDFVQNGAYDETVEFISALREDRPPHPSPAEVLQTVELCHRIAGTF